MTGWLTYLGPALGNHLWQSTAFAVAVWGVTLLLRRNQARVRYGLWLAASLKFLLPFSLLVALGGLLPRPHHAAAVEPVTHAVDAMTQPFSQMPMDVSPVVVAPSRMQRLEHLLPPALAIVWLCGAGTVLLVWGARWRQVRVTLRRATRTEGGREAELLRRVEAVIGDSAHIPLLLSRELMEPGMFGILRPVLIWPERLSDRLDDEHIEAILAHERMHVRRQDNLTAALHMGVEAAFWFHPMVWWMERCMVEERERACDEAVVEMGSQPGIYAESLLKVCRFCVESPLVCVAGVTGADLAMRVRKIMTEGISRKLDLGTKVLLAAVGSAVIAAPVAFGIVRMIPMYGQILHATGPLPSFEVATIKPSDPMNSHENISFDGDRLNATLTTETLIERAYGIRDFQVVGGPKWLDSARYDIVAKSDENWDSSKLTPDQQDALAERQMLRLQSLLASRFQLRVHTTKKEMPIFALVVAKGGPKLLPPKQGEAHRLYTPRPGRLSCYSASMSEFADELLDVGMSRIVVDKTGLTGRYDFSLRWTPDDVAVSGAPNSSAPSMFTAIQEQLGLKLVPSKGPVEVLVIDHIEKPASVDGAEVAPQAASLSAGTTLAPVTTVAAVSQAPVQIASAQNGAAAGAAQPVPPAASGSDTKPEAVLLPGAVYDVATFKPSDPNARLMGGGPSPNGTLILKNLNLKNVICNAYRMCGLRFIGGPGWLGSDRYDIEAKPDSATAEQLLKLTSKERELVQERMLQALLVDRLKLKVHFETREMPIFELVVAKGGLKMHEAQADDTYANGLKRGDGKPSGRGAMTMGHGNMTAQGIVMDNLAANLGNMTDHLVENKTGLTGAYDFTLHSAGDSPPPDSTEPSIYTAIEEQLGLKLVPAKGQMQVLVIDQVERPSPS